MNNSILKAFFVYAYSFVLIFLFNSILMLILTKSGFKPWIGTVISYIIATVFLFFAYRFSVKRFLGKPVSEKEIPKAWLFQFTPFFIISVLLFWILIRLVKEQSLAVFVFLNLELLIIYATFKFSVEKVLER